MHIGILQTGHAPDAMRAAVGTYSQCFERLLAGEGFRFTTWDVVDDIFPERVDAAEGWLITGSKHGAYENLPWIARLEEFLRAAYAAEVPIVGICFGHQILAQALGGRVEKFSGGWAVGPTSYDWGGKTVRLNAWHQDQVVEPPAEADVIARDAFCANAALAYGKRALTIQAHPEYDDAAIEMLIAARGPAMGIPDQLAAARAALGQSDDSAAIATRIAAFFREARDG
ncbi:MAG: type 1 glutamine amidotransferase [Pseudomonadota bacterium]